MVLYAAHLRAASPPCCHRLVRLSGGDGTTGFTMEAEALRAQQAEDAVQRIIDAVCRAAKKWAEKIAKHIGTLKISGGADVVCSLKPELDEDEMSELISKGCGGR